MRDCMYTFYIMQAMVDVADQYNKAFADRLASKVSQYMQIYQRRGGEFAE